MSDETPLDVIQGVPLTVTATVTGGATLWPGERLVRGQVRTHAGGRLLLDLAGDLTTAVVGADVVVTLALSAARTRELASTGVYDVRVSNAGTDESGALRVLHGPVRLELAVTDAPA